MDTFPSQVGVRSRTGISSPTRSPPDPKEGNALHHGAHAKQLYNPSREENEMAKKIWTIGLMVWALACTSKPEVRTADTDLSRDTATDTGAEIRDTATPSNPECSNLEAGVQLKIHSPYTQNPGAVPSWERDAIIWLNMTVLNCSDERFEHDAGFFMEFDPEVIAFEPVSIWGGTLGPGESSILKVTFQETADTDQGREIDVIAHASHAACYYSSEDCSAQTSFPMTFVFEGDLPYFEGEGD